MRSTSTLVTPSVTAGHREAHTREGTRKMGRALTPSVWTDLSATKKYSLRSQEGDFLCLATKGRAGAEVRLQKIALAPSVTLVPRGPEPNRLGMHCRVCSAARRGSNTSLPFRPLLGEPHTQHLTKQSRPQAQPYLWQASERPPILVCKWNRGVSDRPTNWPSRVDMNSSGSKIRRG